MLRLACMLAVLVGIGASSASAQVLLPGPFPPVPVVRASPIRVYAPPLPMVPAVRVAGYAPAPRYAPPRYTVGYATYNTVVPTYYAAPRALTPAYVAPGIGGLPNVYRPGQPVRNALRFIVP